MSPTAVCKHLPGIYDTCVATTDITNDSRHATVQTSGIYFSRTRAPLILLMNKLIRPFVQCGPTSLPRSSQHRRFGSFVFAQVQALDFGLFHSVEFSHMLYVVVMVQPGTWGTSFCFQGGAISSFQPESW